MKKPRWACLPAGPVDDALLTGEPALVYEARAARRAGAAGGAGTGRATALATLARAVMRAFVVKQRSRAVSTRASIAGAVSRITSDTSEMIRNLARSSMRFSRNDRLFDLARNLRLFNTSATSKIEPLRILSELSLNRPFQF